MPTSSINNILFHPFKELPSIENSKNLKFIRKNHFAFLRLC